MNKAGRPRQSAAWLRAGSRTGLQPHPWRASIRLLRPWSGDVHTPKLQWLRLHAPQPTVPQARSTWVLHLLQRLDLQLRLLRQQAGPSAIAAPGARGHLSASPKPLRPGGPARPVAALTRATSRTQQASPLAAAPRGGPPACGPVAAALLVLWRSMPSSDRATVQASAKSLPRSAQPRQSLASQPTRLQPIASQRTPHPNAPVQLQLHRWIVRGNASQEHTAAPPTAARLGLTSTLATQRLPLGVLTLSFPAQNTLAQQAQPSAPRPPATPAPELIARQHTLSSGTQPGTRPGPAHPHGAPAPALLLRQAPGRTQDGGAAAKADAAQAERRLLQRVVQEILQPGRTREALSRSLGQSLGQSLGENVLTPKLLQAVTERVIATVDRRQATERYRLGRY